MLPPEFFACPVLKLSMPDADCSEAPVRISTAPVPSSPDDDDDSRETLPLEVELLPEPLITEISPPLADAESPAVTVTPEPKLLEDVPASIRILPACTLDGPVRKFKTPEAPEAVEPLEISTNPLPENPGEEFSSTAPLVPPELEPLDRLTNPPVIFVETPAVIETEPPVPAALAPELAPAAILTEPP
jgi:hypothetical protein